MRIRVTHETSFAFSGPARALHLTLRMTPRSFESQYVLRWRVGCDIDASLRPSEDAFGSVVHTSELAQAGRALDRLGGRRG